jgi:hypothetical protein
MSDCSFLLTEAPRRNKQWPVDIESVKNRFTANLMLNAWPTIRRMIKRTAGEHEKAVTLGTWFNGHVLADSEYWTPTCSSTSGNRQENAKLFFRQSRQPAVTTPLIMLAFCFPRPSKNTMPATGCKSPITTHHRVREEENIRS